MHWSYNINTLNKYNTLRHNLISFLIFLKQAVLDNCPILFNIPFTTN